MNTRSSMGHDSQTTTQTPEWNTYLTKVGEAQDKAAFSALFEHFSPLLKSFLMSGANLSAENAEDLVQETMIKVWRRSPTFSPAQAAAATWIYTIARNTRIDWFRKHSRQDPQALHADDIYGNIEDESPYSTLVQIRRNGQIREQLGALPQEQSEVLKMMYFQGLSGQQVADALAVPLGTVKSRIRLALAKLKIGLAPKTSQALEGTQSD
jgi:RNA polymerase sigma factor (sigma-70 family)